jgi:endonuclease-3
MTTRERVAQLVEALPEVYPGAHCELDFKTPLQLLVATILSAQCTDKRVNMVTPQLFARYRSAADFARADQLELEGEIRSTGFFRNKAKSIRAAAAAIGERHWWRSAGYNGGACTSCRVLGARRRTWCSATRSAKTRESSSTHMSPGFAATTPNETNRCGKDRARLMKTVPRQHWTMWSHWLIWHGRRRCFARKPDCHQCEILRLCPSGKVFIRTGEARPPDEAANARNVTLHRAVHLNLDDAWTGGSLPVVDARKWGRAYASPRQLRRSSSSSSTTSSNSRRLRFTGPEISITSPRCSSDACASVLLSFPSIIILIGTFARRGGVAGVG